MSLCTLQDDFMMWADSKGMKGLILPGESARIHQSDGEGQCRLPERAFPTKGKNIDKNHEGMREEDQFRELLVIPVLPKHEFLRTE